MPAATAKTPTCAPPRPAAYRVCNECHKRQPARYGPDYLADQDSEGDR